MDFQEVLHPLPVEVPQFAKEWTAAHRELQLIAAAHWEQAMQVFLAPLFGRFPRVTAARFIHHFDSDGDHCCHTIEVLLRPVMIDDGELWWVDDEGDREEEGPDPSDHDEWSDERSDTPEALQLFLDTLNKVFEEMEPLLAHALPQEPREVVFVRDAPAALLREVELDC